MKVSLSKDNRMKREENFEVLTSIKNRISAKIQAEFDDEIKAIRKENDDFFNDEKKFFEELKDFFKKVTPATKLKIVTQVGKGAAVLHEYFGSIEKPLTYNQTYFNFCSPERDNELKPFTVGFSCLQSIEIIEN